jgi:putative transcriptional regulator
MDPARSLRPETAMTNSTSSTANASASGSASAPFDRNEVIALRARYNLTQAKFAKLIGISPDTLRNWETSRRSPMGPARALLRILAADPDKLLTMLHNGPIEIESLGANG